MVFAAAVLTAAAAMITLPMADRHEISMVQGGDPQDEAGRLCRGVLIAAAAALILTAVIGGVTDRLHGPQPGALPGLPGFLAVLLAVQVALLLAVLTVDRGRARPAGPRRWLVRERPALPARRAGRPGRAAGPVPRRHPDLAFCASA